MRIGDLVWEEDTREPDEGAIVFSVSERYGIVPQAQLFNKTIATDDRSKYRRIQFGDIVYNPYLLWNRAVGACFDRRGGCVSPAYIVLRPRLTNTERFLHYLFRSHALTSAVDAIASGSVTRRRTAPVSTVLDLTFDLPTPADQKAANAIIGALDDKIELNRRMSETLEAMARSLFKSWFVDFDPVRAKAERRDPDLPKPLADLFPARLAESALGEIPEGWEVGTLDEFASLNPETWARDTRPDVINYLDLSNTKWGRIETITTYTRDEAPSRAQRVLRSSDTIVGTVRPGNGSYAFIAEDSLTGSTGFAVLRPRKREYAEFVYLAATAIESIDALSYLADGGAYPAVRPEVVAATRAARATDELLEHFSHAVGPLIIKCAAIERESRILAEVRDAVVPKLISGELRVKNAEKLLRKAV